MKNLISILSLMCFFIATMGAQVHSTFQYNSERWSIIPGKAKVSHKPGGPVNGYIYGSDLMVGNQAINWFFTAPPKFQGNQSACYNGTMIFRLKQLKRGQANLKNFYDVVIVGANGLALVYKLPNMPSHQWTPYRIGLRPEDPNWRMMKATALNVNSSKNPWYSPTLPRPTGRHIYSVLTNVKSIHIRGEYKAGDDACALDNVYLLRPSKVQVRR